MVGAGGGRQGGEGAESAGEQSPADLAQAFPGGFQELQRLLRPPGVAGAGGRGGGGGFGGRGQAPEVATGDYLVTLTVGGKSYKQTLRVERVNGTGQGSTFGFEEDEPEWEREALHREPVSREP